MAVIAYDLAAFSGFRYRGISRRTVLINDCLRYPATFLIVIELNQWLRKGDLFILRGTGVADVQGQKTLSLHPIHSIHPGWDAGTV